jgi:hypothetical protein
MKIKLTKNVNAKALESEDSEEKIKKKIVIIKQTVIVTHSRPMALFKEAVKVTEHFCFALHEFHICIRQVCSR